MNETRRAVTKPKLDTELLLVLLGNNDPVRRSNIHSNVNLYTLKAIITLKARSASSLICLEDGTERICQSARPSVIRELYYRIMLLPVSADPSPQYSV